MQQQKDNTTPNAATWGTVKGDHLKTSRGKGIKFL